MPKLKKKVKKVDKKVKEVEVVDGVEEVGDDDVEVEIVSPVLDEVVPQRSYTLEEVQELFKKVNPLCGRGGCLHTKIDHYQGDNPNECHKPMCSCMEFMS